MSDLINITVQNGQAVVTSLEIAQRFGKQHKNVLQSIASITAENSALTQMFFQTTYTTGTGKPYPMYLMNRDGFSLLAMGFTGKEALEWKIKYITAFNQMEQQLRSGASALDARMIQMIENTNALLQALAPVLQSLNSNAEKPKPLEEPPALALGRAALCTHCLYGMNSIPPEVELLGKKDDCYIIRYCNRETGRYETTLISRNWLLPYNAENRKKVLGN